MAFNGQDGARPNHGFFHVTNAPGSVRWLGPKLGEHNREVLRQIGLTDEQIAQMAEQGVI